MKKLLLYLIISLVVCNTNAQFYLRGIVRNEKNVPLASATVLLQSSKLGAITDHDGSFGLNTNLQYDSITVTLEGFEKKVLRVKTDVWQNIILKTSLATLIKNKPTLISSTKDIIKKARFNPFVNDETYFKLIENEFVSTSSFPNSAFSLNVNKASYSNIRRFINMQMTVPTDAVRIEEMVNYFNLAYTPPNGDDIINVNSTFSTCPWNTKNQLLFLEISAKKIDLDKIPAGNFVFLIDVSGSMDMPNRLPLIKEAFQLFVKNLRPIDKVSIVTYGGIVGTWLQPIAGSEKETINKSLELLEAAGETPGESAIEAAYKMAKSNFIVGGNNRVILATDGDFNVGQTSEKALDELITKQRESGIYLTCLGVGMGNFKDSKLQTLAKRGNGNYAYLDDLHEAEKVLVKELTETLYAVADDAFINIQFNADAVSNYRLVGFDNKREAVQDASSDIDGGEIGSGGSTMAIFEIIPPANKITTKSLGNLKLQFHDTKDKIKNLLNIDYDIPAKIDTTNRGINFAAAVAMYGLKLKESVYINKASWTMIKNVADKAADKNDFMQTDFLKLVDKTIDLYEPSKKKKKIKR